MNYIEGLNKFFSDPIWDVISNLFTFLGILGVGITIFRFIHNKRKRHWHSNIEIHDYSYNYDPEEKEYNAIYSKIWDDTPSEYMVTIVFKPIDCIIPKLKVMSIDETTGKSANTIEIFTDLTPNDAVCFRLERAECIPRVKLRWYSDFGEYSEHDFSENLRNGINDVNGTEYHSTFISIIRQALGFR